MFKQKKMMLKNLNIFAAVIFMLMLLSGYAHSEEYQFLLKWGSENSSLGGIAVDSSGKIYVSDNNNHFILKLNSNGKFR